ncbi:PTS fructose transporter subunit IIB [Photobacterium sp. SDRW27]|uniref:PTS fructose transporter subunit IIB n=1 Tax=Photobacterium obscurum TaxID=2829490 RepID=UPI0022448D95|nr:PTS fructose transporter subunit IIB [Photobacterium obscurum]MCW8331035.1 PTS fructose transporter subunit IIB [Photobacterium obscurum]
MYFICVAACPTGVAHTYMAAESLAMVGKSLGHEVKVETQGSLGIENEITAEDVSRADGCIIASEVAIAKKDRFINLPILECAVSDPIKHGEAVFDALCEEIKNG